MIATGTDCSEVADDSLHSQGRLMEISARGDGGGGGQAASGGSRGADGGTEGPAEDLATGGAAASGELPGIPGGNVAEGSNVSESQRAGEISSCDLFETVSHWARKTSSASM